MSHADHVQDEIARLIRERQALLRSLLRAAFDGSLVPTSHVRREEGLRVSESRHLVDKLWSYCNVLRDDGVSTIEYN